MSTYSPFTVSRREASQLVRAARTSSVDNQHCYLLQVTFLPVYGSAPLPQSIFKKLPRLINGIPFGAGKMSANQAQGIQWRYVEEGSTEIQTFISAPMSLEEADEARRLLRDGLMVNAKALFGDITVKTNLILTQCIAFDSDFFVNDIAVPFADGLHFHD